MPDLTAANIEVLRLLNHYRFLTNPQLLRLGLVHDNTSIYKILSRFGDGNRPYIGKKDFGFIAGVGRLHRIYYLQKRGAQLLADTLHLDDDEVSYQKLKPPFLQDYFHRLATIDVHIELDRFAADDQMSLLRRSILLSAIDNYGGLILTLLSIIILSRLLTPNEFGIYAIITSIHVCCRLCVNSAAQIILFKSRTSRIAASEPLSLLTVPSPPH